jgi:hypothetical protein
MRWGNKQNTCERLKIRVYGPQILARKTGEKTLEDQAKDGTMMMMMMMIIIIMIMMAILNTEMTYNSEVQK